MEHQVCQDDWIDSANEFLCTRRNHHKGDHIARGTDPKRPPLARWPRGTGKRPGDPK